ncbi:hypothetical protein ABOC32_27780 [Pseudomonas sp. WOUb67]|uniref:hypothetical protein n=1 Tax=Pseudomonas sp. WOUb67 TaxID=3161136 RepID=UPI003CE830B4
MKKVVPDPPSVFPIPYSTIIADLPYEEAKSHATIVMDSLSNTVKQFIAAEDPAQRSTHLETLSISAVLLHALLAHMKTLEAQA